ncbi:MAG: AAA family ATPase [Leptospiraceae bacterium]|nr:AAA family ATPase [Leptospiraceae bacterium]
MITLTGYEIKEEIYSGEKSIVYRGLKSGKSVIIKVLHNEYPDPIELNGFKREYTVLQKLVSPGAVRVIALEKYKNSVAIVFEDIGGIALSRILTDIRNLPLNEVLAVMIKSAKALGELHKAGLVHKDIKSHNIVLNQKTGDLQIIDFGNASLLTKQNAYTPLNSSLEGTLAYISPEQTGRMNRTIDYRTDYYSLGVTFYQLLTGDFPFTTSDPMELVHAHIAKTPVSPFEKNKTPKVISDIIMKLLQKNPEDRYQSIAGLLYDLEWCGSASLTNRPLSTSTQSASSVQATLSDRTSNTVRLVSEAEPPSLQIGAHDFSGKFQIPEKLYGRTKEINQIIDTFKTVTTGNTKLILISGRSGIGKSALINEVNKPITEYKGYFASGKYDQFKRAIPFHAIAQAFQSLIQQVLTSSQEEIVLWKKNLLQALGSNGQVLVDIIPELENLIGKQPVAVELGASESMNRFNLVFQNFIQAFCTKEHPIAIFLDDLQWADNPSISLIQTILSNPEMKYLYLMLSFRDNEVLPTDPFYMMLEALKKSGFTYKEILLEPISVSDITHLVSDTLSCEQTKAKELATILFEKTKGNPFFVNATFKSLYDKDLLVYKDGIWSWDISQIQNIKMSENVIDLMVSKVKELSPDQIELLKLAACVGDSFPLDTFFSLTDQEIDVVNQELTTISNEGFLLLTKEQVRFVHDKVREATYSLIGEEERIRYHYKIGRLLLENTTLELLEDRIFDILEQLNLGKSLIHSYEEQLELIGLNLKAGKKAKSSTAYQPAFNFLKQGAEILLENKWEMHYELCLEIYKELAECEYLLTHFSEADKLFAYILENAKTPLDKISVIHIQLRQKTSEQKGEEAFRIGFEVLEQFGFKLPDLNKPETTQMLFMEQLGEYKQLLAERPIASLFDLPEMSDPKMKEAISMITNLGDIAILLKSEMLPLMSILGVNLSLKYGNTIVSPISYVMWGVINNLGFKDFNSGYEFGQLSIKLNQEKFPSDLILGKIYAFYGWNIHHYKHHTMNDLDFAKKGYEVTMANSDLVYATYFVIMFLKVAFNIGQTLDEVIEYGERAKIFANKYGQMVTFAFSNPTLMTALALQGKTESPTSLNNSEFSEEEYIKNFSAFGSPTSYFYLRRFQLFYLFGEYEKSLKILPDVEKYFLHMPAHIAYTEFFFYKALLFLSLSTSSNEEEQKRRDEIFAEAYGLLKLWSEHCEDNFLHLLLLVEAEKARVEGRDLEAMQLYEKAIESARKYEYIQNAAIANELACKFYMSKGLEKVAATYLKDAQYLYGFWGATAKVKQIMEIYSTIFHSHHQSGTRTQTRISTTISMESSNTGGSSTTGGSFLDLNTVIKASQTISGEIQLGKLLEKMMKILFENAGAERGFFILKQKEKFYVEAEGNANTETISVLQKKPVEGNPDLSSSIVNYVTRTKGIVLLNDATNKGMFVNDVYVKHRNPKSILCYPVINQGNLVGIVYLENNLTTDAFTPDRVEILKILSSQIAVSVENSLLYANLEEKVEERTKDLNQALVEVRGLKEQQDGDYFLNTLLIEPLGQNNAFSKYVGIEFFIKQKKIFLFRRNEYELGGDINISENIELQGKKYIVFLNGDAMGKSIQGAGGVIVLGTVFKSILQRTISTAAGKNVYPERWLKNAFVEMHKAFESFDGSMLMSIAFGLIDEATGTMYFMNAEHPDMVLYRDGIASFIENPNQYRKLGTQGQTGSICVEVFSLRPDDIIILGSDGRDDIILGQDPETNQDIINKDEHLFLAHVKKAKGDLDQIFEEIKNTGKQMDDISLLRIHYKGVTVDREKLDKDLKLLEDYKEIGKFDKYTEIGSKVISEYPQLTNVLYETSYAFKELKQFEKAIDLGERLRLRDANNIANLLNLVESYNGVGEKDSAKSILDACIKVRPEDVRFLKLKEELG